MRKQDIYSLPQLVISFVNYQLTVKNKSELTVLEYASDLRTFFRFLKIHKNKLLSDSELDQIEISDIDESFIKTIRISDIYAFLAFCQINLGNSPKTRARKVSAIRMFFKFLSSQGIIEENPAQDLDSPNVRKSLPKYLTLEQSQDLLDAIDGQFFERDYCIITFFLNCGIRLAELVSLNLTSIRPDNSVRIIGKGNKERIIYLNDACVHALNRYLQVRPRDGLKDRNALFISRQKNRISRRNVQVIVKKYLENAGIIEEGYSVHKLRHTAATLMYQHGNVDVLLLKEILGHENLSTTQIYTHVANEQIKSAVAANPLASKKSKRKVGESSDT